MAKEKNSLTESDLRTMIEREAKLLLMEMPYERKEYVPTVNINARNAYIHLGKLIVYGNTTNDANGWIDEIVNKFTLPMLMAKVYIGDKAKKKVLENGYINNTFGNSFEDYEEQIKIIIMAAIDKVEDDAQKRRITIPKHEDINTCIIKGKDMIIAYCNAIKQILKTTITIESSYKILQDTLRNELNKLA